MKEYFLKVFNELIFIFNIFFLNTSLKKCFPSINFASAAINSNSKLKFRSRPSKSPAVSQNFPWFTFISWEMISLSRLPKQFLATAFGISL